MSFALLLFLFVSGHSDGAQLAAGPVRALGGKSRQGDLISLLDVGQGGVPSRVIEFSWLKPAEARVVVLQSAPKPLEGLGLARPEDGTLWILADKGRSVARFDENTGKLLHFDALPQPSEGVWDFGKRVVFALMQLRGGEPLLAIAAGGGFRSFSSLRSRTGSTAVETLTMNLFDCGFSARPGLLCWWASGVPESVLINEKEEVEVSPLPSLIDKKHLTPNASPSPSLESLTAGLSYPIRDVFVVSRDSFWVLTNQEGSRPITERGATRSMHVIRVDAGKTARTVELPRSGWAILGGDEAKLLLLYGDGLIGWLNCE